MHFAETRAVTLVLLACTTSIINRRPHPKEEDVRVTILCLNLHKYVHMCPVGRFPHQVPTRHISASYHHVASVCLLGTQNTYPLTGIARGRARERKSHAREASLGSGACICCYSTVIDDRPWIAEPATFPPFFDPMSVLCRKQGTPTKGYPGRLSLSSVGAGVY